MTEREAKAWSRKMQQAKRRKRKQRERKQRREERARLAQLREQGLDLRPIEGKPLYDPNERDLSLVTRAREAGV